MVLITSGIKANLSGRIKKALKEREIDSIAYDKYLNRIYGNTSLSVL